MNPLMPLSTAEMLKQKLEQEILSFNLKPGERLDETKLAERYGTSRTPVREALRHLAAEGFVSIRAHRGAVVAGLSIPELIDMFEMMSVYEGICARLATCRASPEEVEEILIAHEACRVASEANNYDTYSLANARFHEVFYRASHNSQLIKQTLATRNRLGTYRRFQIRRNMRLRDCLREHEGVVSAIKRGDADDADRLMREHVAAQSAHITPLIARLPSEYFAETHAGNAGQRRTAQVLPAAALAFE
jgi:DNA-binding GntR family transcriptional regulator